MLNERVSMVSLPFRDKNEFDWPIYSDTLCPHIGSMITCSLQSIVLSSGFCKDAQAVRDI